MSQWSFEQIANLLAGPAGSVTSLGFVRKSPVKCPLPSLSVWHILGLQDCGVYVCIHMHTHALIHANICFTHTDVDFVFV